MKYRLLAFISCVLLLYCDNSKEKQLDYKYPINENLINCDDLDTGLFQEALQSFEADILNFYAPNTTELSTAYGRFISQAVSNNLNYSEIVSDHSKKIFDVLKKDKTLWTTNSDGSHVNFKHPLFKCIGKHVNDKNTRETFNALISTNSMSLRLFRGLLKPQSYVMKDDHYLASYIALELFYGKLYTISLNNEPKAKTISQI